MKNISFLLLFFAIGAVSLAQQTVYDANAEKRSIGSFHGIDVSAGIEVLITPGNEEALAVSSSDKKMLERVKTVVEDGTLKIYIDNEWKFWDTPKNWKVKAYVSYKQLERIKASSGASVKGDIRAEKLTTKQSSGGYVSLKGEVDKLDVTSSSGGTFKGYDLVANYLVADASSGGGVQVTVNKEVDAEASSGGFVSYKGTAVIRGINVSSGGSVKKVN